MTKIDLEQLTNEIRVMSRQNALYRALKTELSRLGFWRNRPRGNPAKAYKSMRDKSSSEGI